MSFFEKLQHEISEKIDAMAATDVKLHPSWISHAICQDHELGLAPESEDADFWRHAGHRTVRAEVGQYLRKLYGISAEGAAERQLTLDGFDHIQTRYIVNREGDEVAIPTPELTDGELDGIEARLRAMSDALGVHADEIARYKRERAAPSSVTPVPAINEPAVA